MNNTAVDMLSNSSQHLTPITNWSANAHLQTASNLHSHRVFHKGESLYLAGDNFVGIYLLKTGSAKAFINSSEGDEYITEFHMPGDIVGIDGFSKQAYGHTVVFLETSSVLFIKQTEFHHLMSTSQFFRNDILKKMSAALLLEEERQLRSVNYSSKQKIVFFILRLSRRLHACGLRRNDITLSMSRIDIANHTGMVIETVSRVLRQLQQAQLIDYKHRQIDILNEVGMRNLLLNNSEKH